MLRKDFTIDADQVYETKAIGADAILLIVAALPDDGYLRELHELATDLGLSPLVEVHDDAELDRALAIDATFVGINARNLGTFDEDLGIGERLVGSPARRRGVRRRERDPVGRRRRADGGRRVRRGPRR